MALVNINIGRVEVWMRAESADLTVARCGGQCMCAYEPTFFHRGSPCAAGMRERERERAPLPCGKFCEAEMRTKCESFKAKERERLRGAADSSRHRRLHLELDLHHLVFFARHPPSSCRILERRRFCLLHALYDPCSRIRHVQVQLRDLNTTWPSSCAVLDVDSAADCIHPSISVFFAYESRSHPRGSRDCDP